MSLINVDDDNGVRRLTLNRPEALNAFTPDLLRMLVDEVQKANADERVRVMILQGAGRAFSAGVDLKVLQGIEPVAGRISNIFDEIAVSATQIIRTARMPIIAKVHGFCFTGALEMALHCDFILTTEGTKFGDTHAKWGLRPTWGMSQNLARAIGVRRARDLSFTARTFTGAQAHEWGLANEVAPDLEGLDDLAGERAAAISQMSPGAVSAYKKLYRVHEEMLPLEEALIKETDNEFPEITDSAERLRGFGST